MQWYNGNNFHRKGGDHMKATFTSENSVLGVSWRLIVGVEERMSESMPSRDARAHLCCLSSLPRFD